MRKSKLLLCITLLVLQALACKIVVVKDDEEGKTAASQLPALVKPVPTLEDDNCLIVHALPGGQGGALNLRAGAGTSYPVVAVLRDGQKLEMNGRSGDWLAVTVWVGDEIFIGYVRADYVEDCEWK